ncbi:MAG: cellulase N-terminal Ig-like domain-containing protein [Candidatus Sumerlaeia bacterium]
MNSEKQQQHLTRILTNHIGYDCRAPKRAVMRTWQSQGEVPFALINDATGKAVFEGVMVEEGPVHKWRDWYFYSADFSECTQAGGYIIEARLPFGKVQSAVFEIADHQLLKNTITDVLFYYKGQRHTGEVDAADREATFIDDPNTMIDVHGGWNDASADWSKNLSHLNHSSYMNPNQAPMPVWTMLETVERLEGCDFVGTEALLRRLREEAIYGADLLVRMQNPAGYFYEMAGYNRRTKKTMISDKTYGYGKEDKDTYQAGMRQGAGVTIAALARIAAAELPGDYTPELYLDAAIRGFAHLDAYNQEYLNDGKENILDDYCGLLAATEIGLAMDDGVWLKKARNRMESLTARFCTNDQYTDWLRADDEGKRPYFHPSDEGLPVVALLRYLRLEKDSAHREKAIDAIRRFLKFQLAITGEVTNPFQYARQLVRDYSDTEFRATFFQPHDNDTRYWWQGENARIASIATSFAMACADLKDDPQLDREALLEKALSQLNWVLGMNPFDACMLHGKGRNNKEFVYECPNAPGGIYNGITAHPDDREGICYLVDEHAHDFKNSWRWTEQWLPHTAWFMPAVALLSRAMEK